MKIIFDAEPLCSVQPTGIGTVADELCRLIVKNHPENEYGYNYFSLRNPEAIRKKMDTYRSENSRVKCCRLLSSGMYKLACGVIPLPYRMFFGGKGDITHFFNFIIPPGVKGKKVVTVHDLAFRRFPETVNLKTRKYLEMRLKSTVKRAEHIIVVSEFTAKELTEYYGVPRSRMTIVYNGVDFGAYGVKTKDEKKRDILKKYSLEEGNYFFYLGTIEPRKNLARMTEAYSLFVKEAEKRGEQVPDLVLGGKLGWYYDEIMRTIKNGGAEHKIKLLGYVDDADKPCLYENCAAFVFPSLYEGFGMPVAEAMACGAPVLTSRTSSLPEVAGEYAVYCDPLDTDSIRAGFEKLYSDKALCAELSEKGREWVKKFSWEAAADKLYSVYRSLLDNKDK